MEVDDLDAFSQAVIGLVDRKARFHLKKMEVIKEFWVMYDSSKHSLKINYGVNLMAALELLQLNQEDDQGIREHLIKLYLERGQYQDANRVREAYLYDEYIDMLYNDILISIGLNHSNETIKDKIEKAQKSNPSVITLLTKSEVYLKDKTFETKWMQVEAMNYLDENIHLWKGKEDYLKGI